MDNNQDFNNQQNNFQQEEEGFTFKMLGALIKRVLPMTIVWVLCAVFVSFAVGFSLNLAVNRDKTITAIVNFDFEGIDNGLDPEGNKFDANILKSSVNVSETLRKMGLSEEYTNSNVIADNITVTGLVPANIAQELLLLQQLDTKDPNVLLAISKIKYNSNRFVISYNFTDVSPIMEEKVALSFVSNLIDQYLIYFENKYARAEVFSKDIFESDILLFNDYVEAYDIYKGEFDIIQSYLNEIKAKASDYRSNTTNLKIPDLISRMNPIYVSLTNYESFVTTNGVTKDSGTTVAYLKNTLQKYTNKVNAAETEISELNKQLEAYKMPDIIIKGDNGENVDFTQIVTKAYDDMQQRVANLISTKKFYVEEISNLNDRINAYQSHNTIVDKDAMQKNMALAQEKLTAINTNMLVLVDIMNKTILDYNKDIVIGNAMNVEGVPAVTNIVSLPINWILVVGIGVIVGVIGGVICGQTVYVLRKRKRAIAAAKAAKTETV